MKARPLNPGADAERVAWVLAASFGNGIIRPDAVRRIRRTKPGECENVRIMEDGGRAVAYLEIGRKEVYVGRARLTVAGIAGVCTDPSLRMKGYAGALLVDTVEFARRKKYDLCLLYGIPDFYHKVGFEVVMARHFITLAQSDLPLDYGPQRASKIRKEDMQAIRALYNARTKYRDGNRHRRKMAVPSGFKLTDARGRISAYAAWVRADSTLLVKEAIASDAVAAAGLLRALRRIAWREGLDLLNVEMPFGYPFTDALRTFNCTCHRVNTRRKGCMGHVTNLPSVVRKMTPEWTRLLEHSEFVDQNARLAVKIGNDAVRFDWSAGRLKAALGHGRTRILLTPQQFVQMVFGYRSVSNIIAEAGLPITGKDKRLLDVLFPERNAFLFTLDHF